MREEWDPAYDYRPLARRYAERLPVNSSIDWEDLHQEMLLASWRYQSIKSVRWAATTSIRKERRVAAPKEIEWARRHSPRLDTICQIAELIRRWPWLIGYLFEDSGRAIARKAGIGETSIAQRINVIRSNLGLAKRYRRH